jgi:hypothetical protein
MDDLPEVMNRGVISLRIGTDPHNPLFGTVHNLLSLPTRAPKPPLLLHPLSLISTLACSSPSFRDAPTPNHIAVTLSRS